MGTTIFGTVNVVIVLYFGLGWGCNKRTRQLIFGRTMEEILIDFSLTVNAATVIFIFWRGTAISSAKQGKSGSIYNSAKN